jgi:caa(3)-type oxidase subunit IV
MWIFLLTEVMLFGGLFASYAVYRTLYAEAFLAAGRHLDLVLGALNTAVLLASSLAAVLGVEALREDRRRAAGLLGLLFLSVTVSLLPLGWAAMPLALGIACAKAILIAVDFMHLREGPGVLALVAASGVLWLVLLLGLTLADYLSRGWGPVVPGW